MLRIRKKHRKIDWHKGSGELIGIALAMPLLCVILIMIIGIIQTGIARQTLEHAAYLGARAAVTCDNQTDAETQAYAVIDATLSANTFSIDTDNINVDIALVSGTSDTLTGGTTIAWEKGALIKLQVTVPYYSMATFSENTMSSILYMMVEKPAKTYY